jgi:hypothetical protein
LTTFKEKRVASATFQIGTTVKTEENAVDVTVTPSAPLPAGVHHFQLVVIDENGNQSDPATAQVVIKDSIKPTAVLRIAPSQVEPGVGFRLDGSASSDVAPGKVVQYVWMMID